MNGSRATRNISTGSSSLENSKATRWGLLGASAALAVLACGARLGGWVEESAAVWIFHTMIKVAVLLMATSLAWPQLTSLRRSGYGRLVLAGLMAMVGLFMLRPRAILAAAPFIAAAIAVLAAVTFLRNMFTGPPQRPGR